MAQSEPTVEFSANFDAENVRPFLLRVKELCESGFGEEQVESVCAALQTLAVDQEHEWEFPVAHRRQSVILQVRIVMDDVDAPDLYLFGPASLISSIEESFRRFAAELGI